MKKFFFIIVLLINISNTISARADREERPRIKQIKKGNFSLPPSQEMGPLFSFGQNVVQKGSFQTFLYADQWRGQRKVFADLYPSILYAITDNLSIYAYTSIATNFRINESKSSGIEDTFLQAEYAFYNKNTKNRSFQSTIVGNISIPTGSYSKNPQTGFGAPSIFLGFTFNYMDVRWYAYASPGVTLVIPLKHNVNGNQFFYQCGIGRNIWSPKGWIIGCILEFSGLYVQSHGANSNNNQDDRNFGGHTIYLGPSLWVSSRRLILQLGIQFLVMEKLFGNQNKNYFVVESGIGWRF